MRPTNSQAAKGTTAASVGAEIARPGRRLAGSRQVPRAQGRGPLFRDPLAVTGLTIMALIILFTFVAPQIYSWDEIIAVSNATKLLPPSAAHTVRHR